MMPKLSRTPKKQQAPKLDADEAPSIFDHFGLEDTSKPKAQAAPAKDTSEPDPRIAEMQKRLDDLQRANLALMTQAPSHTGTQVPVAPKALDLSGLPDPVAEPDKYTAELNRRINSNIEERLNFSTQQQTQQREYQAKYDDLWKDFANNEAYKDIAADEDRVTIAAGRVLDKAKARGIDPQRYITTGREQFFGDIASEYKALFGDRKLGADDLDNTDTEDEGEDNSRAMSIFGGLEGSGKPQGKETGKAALGDMVKDIQDIQRRTGFY